MYTASAPAWAKIARFLASAALRGPTIPTMLVRGGLSDVVTGAIAEEFAGLVPGARVVEVARAAHMVAGDDNAGFTDAVLSFVEALPIPSR